MIPYTIMVGVFIVCHEYNLKVFNNTWFIRNRAAACEICVLEFWCSLYSF